MAFKTLREKLEEKGLIPAGSKSFAEVGQELGGPIHEQAAAASMTAREVPRAIVLMAVHLIEGEYVLETTCSDYENYRALPNAVEYQGRVYGKTGWSSDRNYACYKSGTPIAYASLLGCRVLLKGGVKGPVRAVDVNGNIEVSNENEKLQHHYWFKVGEVEAVLTPKG